MRQKDRERRAATRRLAICAMLAALGVVLLYVGSLIEIVDISMAVIASMLCVVAVIEYGGAMPFMIYGVTAVLSFLLLPNKTPAAFYALFFGFYPILKEKFERRGKVLSWVLKEIAFNISLAIIATLAVLVMLGENNALLKNPYIIGVAVLLCEAVFVLYDIALTRLISFYVITLRHRFKFK